MIIIRDEESRDVLKLDILRENVASSWISTIFLELSEFWCSEGKSRRVWNVEDDSNAFALVQVDKHMLSNREDTGELPSGLQKYYDKKGQLPSGLQSMKNEDGKLTKGLTTGGKKLTTNAKGKKPSK